MKKIKNPEKDGEKLNMKPTSNKNSTGSNREWWVDYLRVFAVFLVIPFHIVISYVPDVFGEGINFSIWNDTFYESARKFFEFFNPWHMQLLFCLAGFSLVFALKKRTYKEFALERLIRLGIPIIFGLILWNAVMGWFSIRFIYELYPELNPLQEIPGFWMYYIYWWWEGGLINTGHLWFLVVLLVLSLLAGFIISRIYLRSRVSKGKQEEIQVIENQNVLSQNTNLIEKEDEKKHQDRSSRIQSFLTHPVVILLWAAISTILDYIPIIFSFFQYNQFLFFIFGIVIASKIKNLKRIGKHFKWTLPLGLSLLILWVFFPLDYLLILKNIGAWYFIYGLIGLTSLKLKKPSRSLRYLSKASMPVYILHLPLEIIVGYYLIRLPINPFLEIFLLIIINLVLCFGVYELIRRINRKLPGIGIIIGIREKRMKQKARRIFAVVQMEIKRLLREPLALMFTILLVPVLILLFGLIMGDNYGWHPEFSIFEIMLPGFITYACLLTIYDVAASVANESELGLQKRINTTPLTTAEYIFSQMISYTIKPLIQLILGLGVAFIVGFRPSTSITGYLVVIAFMVFLTFCSVGFGLICANFARSASAAGGLAFAFIVPQQIFATFIPAAFMGADKFAWIFPSYYATDGLSIIFAGTPLTDTRIWIRLGILFAISIVIYGIGIILYEKNKKS